MRRGVAIVLALSGCDKIWLDERAEPDANTGCWSTQHQMRDEDDDGVVDGCDNCPAVRNTPQDNGDSDGVGDVCDPRPGELERIAYFNGFDEPESLDEFVRVGNWALSGGSVFQQDTIFRATARLPLTFNGAFVRVVVGPISQPIGSDTEAGVFISTTNLNMVGENGLGCTIRKRGGMPTLGLFFRLGPPGEPTVNQPVDPGNAAIIDAWVSRNGKPACVIDGVTNANLQLVNAGPVAGDVVLVTDRATAEFKSITVLEPM